MTVSNTLTFDAATPYRPALADITGGTKINRPGRAPNPETQPTAEEDNQKSAQTAAFGRTTYLARLTVTISGGTPAITNILAPRSVIEATDFTVTDNGAGDTTIRWASSVLPPVSGAPDVSQCDDVEIDRLRAFYGTLSGQQGVRVKSKLGATATDANFVVTIY